MNIVFLGLMFCEKALKEAYSYSNDGLQMATHIFQSNLLHGFKQCDDVEVKVYNVPPIGSFPFNYKKLISHRYVWGEKNNQIGYINFPIIKHIQQVCALRKCLEADIKSDSKLNIIVYDLYEPFLWVVDRLKAKYPDISVCLIQTDAVPGRDDMEEYMTKRNVRKGDRAVALTKSFDMFVLLSKYLKDTLEVGSRPSLIMECVCDDIQEMSKIKDTSEKVCLYTGSTDRVFGIKELVTAFQTIEDAELWICGAGDTDEYLEECHEKYPNIKFYGFVDRDKLAKFRDHCDYLINPRRPSGTYTKYSFPSKTMEYLMSGKPCIMYKLEGVPDEYDSYLNYLNGETPEKIREELINIFNKDYKILLHNAINARRFVLENKSSKVQASRIVALFKKRRKQVEKY